MLRRDLHRVVAHEEVGAYTMLRVARRDLDPGIPGQFFMLQPPGRLLPRPMSLCLAPSGELAFLIDPVGPGTRALCALARGDELAVLGPLGNGFRLDVRRPLLVGGGIGIAPLPFLSDRLGGPRALLGFRSALHAQAAELVPNAEVVLDPTYVTDVIPPGHDVLSCGPEPMLAAVRRLEPAAQLAWEAPMACGYGACYGCAVEIDGELRRLCVDGPVLEAVGVASHAPRTREGAATFALGASSVAPVASSYEGSLRPSESGVSRLAGTNRAEGDPRAA
jgi:NAD(P)H-flavin reductase